MPKDRHSASDFLERDSLDSVKIWTDLTFRYLEWYCILFIRKDSQSARGQIGLAQLIWFQAQPTVTDARQHTCASTIVYEETSLVRPYHDLVGFVREICTVAQEL